MDERLMLSHEDSYAIAICKFRTRLSAGGGIKFNWYDKPAHKVTKERGTFYVRTYRRVKGKEYEVCPPALYFPTSARPPKNLTRMVMRYLTKQYKENAKGNKNVAIN